jgi:hypothetical protein
MQPLLRINRGRLGAYFSWLGEVKDLKAWLKARRGKTCAWPVFAPLLLVFVFWLLP